MSKYRKKPVVVEAIQYTGSNIDEVDKFINLGEYLYSTGNIVISTLEGDMIANVGDYIIKGVNGEFYPCKPNIFAKTYEKLNNKFDK
jgi:hypothetical protein